VDHIRQFDRQASRYQDRKIIQSRVARHLVQKSPYRGRSILDLGAGSGEVFRNIDWPIERFYAADASRQMLDLHPPCTRKILCNFDLPSCFRELERLPIDQIFASSSLQWSRDLEATLRRIASLRLPTSLAIFTASTFKTVHQLANISSPIYEKGEVIRLIEQFFHGEWEVREYKLFFPEKIEAFRYIKESGVSQGVKRLSYREMRELIDNYPHPYLEFEVLFMWSDLSKL